jgi:hypothetical protein
MVHPLTLIPRSFLYFRRVHFVTAANLPDSMTDTVYDVAKKRAGPDGDLSFHITLIDTVMLSEDLEFLLPLTAIYVKNSGWDDDDDVIIRLRRREMEGSPSREGDETVFSPSECDTAQAAAQATARSDTAKATAPAEASITIIDCTSAGEREKDKERRTK